METNNNTINNSQVDVQAQSGFNPAPQDQMFAIAQMMKQMMGELAEIKQSRTRKSSEPHARQDWRAAYRAACERTDKVEAGIQFFAATDEERKAWADEHDGVCIVKVDDMEYAFTPGVVEHDEKGNLTWVCEVCFKCVGTYYTSYTVRRPRNGFYTMLRAQAWIESWKRAEYTALKVALATRMQFIDSLERAAKTRAEAEDKADAERAAKTRAEAEDKADAEAEK